MTKHELRQNLLQERRGIAADTKAFWDMLVFERAHKQRAFQRAERVHVFGVFDGHNGDFAAHYCRAALPQYFSEALRRLCPGPGPDPDSKAVETSLRETFRALDERLCNDEKCRAEVAGTTAIVAAIAGHSIYVANCGDSRAVVCDKRRQAIAMSTDHTPHLSRERERIEAAGGFVTYDHKTGRYLTMHKLAMTRAIGDADLKPFVTSEPEVTRHELVEGEFLILASDGIWDVVSNQDAVDHVVEVYDREAPTKDTASALSAACKSLVRRAFQRGSRDNMTVMVVKL